MSEIILGISVDAGSFSELEKQLSLYQKIGYQWVEIDIGRYPLMINGEPCLPMVQKLAECLKAYPFRYSLHIGRGCDFRSQGNLELVKKNYFSSVLVASKIGAERLVLHFEEKSKDQSIEGYFESMHLELADYATQHQVLLCLENIEVELTDAATSCVERLNHPNLCMTLDTGHAFLSANYFHTDLLEDVKKAAPLVSHVHLNDNTGDFELLRLTNRLIYDALPQIYRIAFGKGDIHLPPLFGALPFAKVLSLLNQYQQCVARQQDLVLICEYECSRFEPCAEEIYASVKELIQVNMKGDANE